VDPAVSIDIFPELSYTKAGRETITEKAVCERIDCLKEGERTRGIGHQFVEDVKHKILGSFVRSPSISWLTTIKLTTLYKNVTNGTFRADLTYQLWPRERDEKKLKKWHAALKVAKTKYSKRIDEYERSKRLSKRQKIMGEINRMFQSDVGKTNIKLYPHLVPGSFSVTPIAEEEYLHEIKQRGKTYARLLGVR